MLITSPSSINIDESIKKKKWPNLEQYEYIKEMVEIILFNAIFFFHKKIVIYKNQENEFSFKLEFEEQRKKEKEKEEKEEKDEIKEDDKREKGDESDKIIENCKMNLECISSLKRLYIENLGYILKILNKIYRGVKEDESQNKGFMY